MTAQLLWLAAAGFAAGFIDAIAGGGGLITLPSLVLAVGAGAHAIGSNKIPGTIAAFVALLVYRKAGHFDGAKSVRFALWVGAGSLVGSRLSPFLPPAMFPYLLATTCPIILFVVWRREIWVAREIAHPGGHAHAIALTGFAAGLYDGMWGPGGGTFMFLGLLFAAKLPLLTALAASKLANTVSAGVSFVSYASSGLVHYPQGLAIAAGIVPGAFLGAKVASRAASRIVRPILVIVVALLLLKLTL